jgi:polyhydroxybutyrate depolymerase
VRLIRLVAAALVLSIMGMVAALVAARAQDLDAETGTVVAGGMQRTYLIHVPPAVARPAPLVLVFHGGGGAPAGMMRSVGMNDVADRNHFIVVYPAGVGRARGGTWDIGTPDSRSQADDVGFVQAILQEVGQRYPIDPRRIYATGESMGGVFSYRLACEMSETFAAVAPVAASMDYPGCRPRSPVAVFDVHGTADDVIPLNGGLVPLTPMGRTWPPVEQGISFWTRADGCPGASTTRSDGPETTCRIFQSCRAPVEACLVTNGGHAWPGSPPLRWQQRYGVYVSQTFPTSERVWAFFAANPKR